MKKRLQFLACLLAAVFLLGSTGAFADSQAPGTLQGISAERLANQEVSNLAYSKILEHYGQEAYMLPEEAESGNPSILRTTPDYGDVYAGAYLNEDGQLVVLLADPDASKASTKPVSADRPNILSEEIVSGSSAFKALPAAMKAEANELLAVSGKSTLIFQKAKYSYDYLTALTEMLSAELSAKHKTDGAEREAQKPSAEGAQEDGLHDIACHGRMGVGAVACNADDAQQPRLGGIAARTQWIAACDA